MPEKKKILLFIDWFLPGYRAGGPIRSCANLIERLQDDHEFYVVTRNTDYLSSTPYEDIESDAWNTRGASTQVLYLSENTLTRSRIARIFDEVPFDVVYINGMFSWYFSLLPIYYASRFSDKKIVVAARGMLAKSAISQKRWKKSLFLQVMKRFGLYKKVTFHATNEKEAGDIRRAISGEAAIRVATNLSRIPEGWIRNVPQKEKGKLRLVSIARIAPEKNTLYALEVLKEVKAACEVTFDLYGPVYDEPYWQKCRSLIDTLGEHLTVRKMESVESERVRAVLQQYHILFLPTKGENFGHIILEAMAAGLPVLISDQTPWKGLSDKGVGRDLPLSDPAAFTQACGELCAMENDPYQKLSGKALAYAREVIEAPEAVEQNKKLFS